MNLFQSGNFTLHSGSQSNYKIDCDALTDADWETIALVLTQKLPVFNRVIGIPRGGLKLAEKLQKYCKENTFNVTLICDDVLTTGKSMEEERKKHINTIGAVAFARGKCPSWIYPLCVINQYPQFETIELLTRCQELLEKILDQRMKAYSLPESKINEKLRNLLIDLETIVQKE